MPTRRIDTGWNKWDTEICKHPDHEFPNMMYIPAGEVWEHTCPACGKKTIVRSSSLIY